MERLILLLLSPAIFAERLKINDPNNEPFLPIYPTYPYNPKLIKRGAEQELVSQLTPESYEAPKEDTRDSYSTSYNNNYQRDSYSNYNPYDKNTSPSPIYNPYYNENPYAYTSSPYVAYNPYPTPYHAMSPAAYPAPSYPDYYYQPPYYYSHYFNHALFPPPPPPPPPPLPPPLPPSVNVDYRETSQDSTETENDKQDKDKKSKKPKQDETNRDASASQFVDGGNYISGNSRDLDGQSSTYKVTSPYNQVEQDVQVKNPSIPLPKTTYRVISVAGQPVGPDYPLPAQYVKAQQIEHLMSQTLAKLFAQNEQQQVGQSYESNKDSLSDVNDGSNVNQDTYNPSTQSYVAVPGAKTKTGGYVINSDGVAKVNGEQVNSQVTSSQTTSSRNAKYPNNLYVRKPATHAILGQPQTTLDLSQVTYVSQQGNRNKHRERVNSRPTDHESTVADEYDSYDVTQSYTSSPFDSKREQNYENYQRQTGTYRSKDFIAVPQTPRTYSYQYSAYESDQATTAEQPQQDKVNSDDGDFGVKQYNKG
ncbi:uncharacterized protein LOC116841222 [Odontomachus brunneus]|uniref:uncharacterized protein LOC116841222 n=1 Tax=Odontomachus brunneus TaxID=486640 RepID=UPI0013F22E4D|nr:uncharacterized protein LOC116841222 [Odontomachus brunneus]